MAGIGVQLKGIALQENYLWGANDGGTWDNPAQGSMWNLQDQMTKLNHQSTMADFASNKWRMETGNEFSIRQEDISQQRMETSQNFQRWNSGFTQAGQQMQRGWTQQDWQYQDTMNSLQFGWNMEDIDEGIRTSTGRQRKQLIRQKERASLTQNLEGEQTDKSRERQQEMWSREDERYAKQTQYSEDLMDLDEKQFDLSKEQRQTMYEFERRELARKMDDYLKQKKLQDQIQDKQREYQYEQLQLQKESAGIQAAAAKAQKDYNDAMLLISGHRRNRNRRPSRRCSRTTRPSS